MAITRWEQLSEHEQLSSIHYDLYKDVYNFRPRWVDYSTLSVEQLREMIDQLLAQQVVVEQEAREAEEAAIRRFEERINLVVSSGAGDRETALRWIMEADGVNGDWDHLCFLNGLPFGYVKSPAA